MKRLLLLPLLCMILRSADAQTITFKKHEVSWGIGIVSLDELKGFAGNEPVSVYMSFPYVITAAHFVTYRYRFNKRFSVGGTIGLDNQTGDLSYGDEHHGSFGGGIGGISGRYDRHAYTFAVEARMSYVWHRHYSFGGYIGAGYCAANTKYTFFQGIRAQEYFYGTPTSLVPTNPYIYRHGYPTFQFTPLSLRFGGTVAGFFEMGFGYKGMFCGGLSARF